MNLDTLHAFEGEVRKTVPQFKLAYKDQSAFMKVLGFFMTAFNPGFMTDYTTTIGNTVYFPTQSFYEIQTRASFTVLAHEMVHMVDGQKNGPLFKLSYLFPQILGPIAIAVYIALARLHSWPLAILAGGLVLACWLAKKSTVAFWIALGLAFVGSSALLVWLSGWLSAVYFGGLALFAPWPAPWRTKWEGRGYVMSLAVLAWMDGPPPIVALDHVTEYFTGSFYYFMSWSKPAVENMLNAGIAGAQSGALQKEQPYGQVYDFLAAQGQLRK